MIWVFGWIAFDPNAASSFLAAAARASAATRAEAGCVFAHHGLAHDRPGRLLLVETYRDWPALREHLRSPHIARFNCDARAAGMTELDVKALDGEGWRQLLGADGGGPAGRVGLPPEA